MFRHGPQGLVESLEDAEFRFGRFTSEFDIDDRVARLPSALTKAVEGSDLEAAALESGLLVEFSIKESQKASAGWFCMNMVAEGTEARGSIKRNRWAYSELEGIDTVEIIQVSPFTGSEMPVRIWMKVSELPPGSLLWAMDNGVLEGGSSDLDAGQESLAHWVEIKRGERLESDSPEPKKMVLPGQPHFSYVFDD